MVTAYWMRELIASETIRSCPLYCASALMNEREMDGPPEGMEARHIGTTGDGRQP
jgi:hypothetical protein